MLGCLITTITITTTDCSNTDTHNICRCTEMLTNADDNILMDMRRHFTADDTRYSKLALAMLNCLHSKNIYL